MTTYGWELLIVCHHSAKFGGHTIAVMAIFLICHLISEEHMIKGSFDNMGRRPSMQVTILASLVTISIVVQEMVLIRHVISQDKGIKGPYDFIAENPLT